MSIDLSNYHQESFRIPTPFVMEARLWCEGFLKQSTEFPASITRDQFRRNSVSGGIQEPDFSLQQRLAQQPKEIHFGCLPLHSVLYSNKEMSVKFYSFPSAPYLSMIRVPRKKEVINDLLTGDIEMQIKRN